jgi:hypothetical protein
MVVQAGAVKGLTVRIIYEGSVDVEFYLVFVGMRW